MAEEMGYKVEPTPQSQRGHYFLGPGGEKYSNKGRVQLRALDEESRECITRFHIADGIEQALGSVAEMNDSGNLLIFDNEGSAMIPGKSPEAAAIRKAMMRCKRKMKIHRRKNSFYMPIWVQPEANNEKKSAVNTTPFGGQGR